MLGGVGQATVWCLTAWFRFGFIAGHRACPLDHESQEGPHRDPGEASPGHHLAVGVSQDIGPLRRVGIGALAEPLGSASRRKPPGSFQKRRLLSFAWIDIPVPANSACNTYRVALPMTLDRRIVP